MKTAVSVTLSAENLVWLRARAAASARGSLSQLLDDLVASARTAGAAPAGRSQSVAGTIDLPDDDPDLEKADAYIRNLVDGSLARPVVVKEAGAAYRRPKRRA